MEARRLRSHAALARCLGKPLNRLSRVLKLLELPEPIKAFLREHRSPVYLRYFSEPRMTELLRLGDARTAWQRFREMRGGRCSTILRIQNPRGVREW